MSEPGSIDQKELTVWIDAMVKLFFSLILIFERCSLQYDVADMPSRGRGGTNDPKETAKKIMNTFDKGGDKKLFKDEFIRGYAYVCKSSSFSMFY